MKNEMKNNFFVSFGHVKVAISDAPKGQVEGRCGGNPKGR